MEPKLSRVVATREAARSVSQEVPLRPDSNAGPSYTLRDIFFDPDPRITLWERIKAGASLPLVPFALVAGCGGDDPGGDDGDIVEDPDNPWDAVSGDDADYGEVYDDSDYPPTNQPPDDGPEGSDTPGQNHSPIFDEIDSVTVSEGNLLDFSVYASDPDEGDIIGYSTEGLPDSATFNARSGYFSWRPDFSQAGIYRVRFFATDGLATDSEEVSISVLDVPYDFDGDGFVEGVDCNDDDPNTRPLPSPDGNASIDSDTTICPGIYEGVLISIGASSLTLRMPGVTLFHTDSSTNDTALEVISRSNVTITGAGAESDFAIRGYPTGINIADSNHVTVVEGSVYDAREAAISISSSPNCAVMNNFVAGAIYISNSDNATLDNIEMPLIEGLHEYIVMTNSNGSLVEGSRLAGGGIKVEDSDSVQILGNDLSGESYSPFAGESKLRLNRCDDCRVSQNDIADSWARGFNGALTIFGSNIAVEDNRIEGNNGDATFVGGTTNTFMRNIVRFNRGRGVNMFHFLDNLGSWVWGSWIIEDNVSTDNGGEGLHVSGCGHTIRNNDLRRNGLVNEYSCRCSACSGNLQ